MAIACSAASNSLVLFLGLAKKTHRQKAEKTYLDGMRWDRRLPERRKEQETQLGRLSETRAPMRREAQSRRNPQATSSRMTPHPRRSGTSSHSPAAPSRPTAGTPGGRGSEPTLAMRFPAKRTTRVGNDLRLSGIEVDDEGHLRCPWRNPCGRRESTDLAGSSRRRSCPIVRHPPSLGIPDSCTLEPTRRWTWSLLLSSRAHGRIPGRVLGAVDAGRPADRLSGDMVDRCRRDDRQLCQRRRLASASRRESFASRVALPLLRSAGSVLRQHSRRQLLRVARPLSRLRSPHFAAIPNRRSPLRSVVPCGGSGRGGRRARQSSAS